MANIIEVSSDEESFFDVDLESDRKGVFSFGIDWDEIYMDSSDDDDLVSIDLVSKERTGPVTVILLKERNLLVYH